MSYSRQRSPPPFSPLRPSPLKNSFVTFGVNTEHILTRHGEIEHTTEIHNLDSNGTFPQNNSIPKSGNNVYIDFSNKMVYKIIERKLK